MKTIGNRLKHARTVRGMSQTALAQKIGASRGVITNIERDIVTEPQSIVIKAICRCLSINEKWLVDGTGPMDHYSGNRRSEEVLDEICYYVSRLTEDEQLFILDIIQSYINRMGQK